MFCARVPPQSIWSRQGLCLYSFVCCACIGSTLSSGSLEGTFPFLFHSGDYDVEGLYSLPEELSDMVLLGKRPLSPH